MSQRLLIPNSCFRATAAPEKKETSRLFRKSSAHDNVDNFFQSIAPRPRPYTKIHSYHYATQNRIDWAFSGRGIVLRQDGPHGHFASDMIFGGSDDSFGKLMPRRLLCAAIMVCSPRFNFAATHSGH